MRAYPLLALSLCLALACGKSDPNSVEDQVKVLTRKDASTKEKQKALEQLRKLGKKEAVPGLCNALQTASPKIKAEIASLLAELKDPAAAKPLADSLALVAASGEWDGSNEKIVRALSDLGDKSVVPTLLKLLEVTQSNFVKFEVLNALPRLGGEEAIPVLLKLAMDPEVEPPINKKAMAALAALKAPQALPLFLKGLYFQRGSMSLYPDAAYGLFRLRPASSDAVLALLNGKDKDTAAFAKEKEVPPAVFATVASQVAGHLQDKRMVPALVRQLHFKDADPDMALMAQTAAVESLGRMRARAAIPALVELLKGEDRVKVALALSRIGDKSVLAKLAACSTNGIWVSREGCIQGVVALGGKAEAKLFDGFIKEEPKRFLGECKQGIYGEVDCDKERVRVVEERTKSLKAYQQALETVGRCEDAKCLAEALAHEDPVVREKAAYAAAQRKDPETLPALVAAITRPAKGEADLVPRVAAVLAVDWMVGDDAAAREKVKAELPALQALVEKDSRIAANAESCEEVQRLVDVIQNGRSPAIADAEPEPEAAGEEEAPAPKPVKKPAKKGKRGK